jgi:hypothetical protein
MNQSINIHEGISKFSRNILADRVESFGAMKLAKCIVDLLAPVDSEYSGHKVHMWKGEFLRRSLRQPLSSIGIK